VKENALGHWGLLRQILTTTTTTTNELNNYEEIITK
jgi:hypothetical protein